MSSGSANDSLEELLKARTEADMQTVQMKQWFISAISASEENKSSVAMPQMSFRVRAADSPNVRKQPTTTSRIVGHASPGGEYEVLDLSPGVWFRIRLENGNTGWISSKLGSLTQLHFFFEEETNEPAPADPPADPENAPSDDSGPGEG